MDILSTLQHDNIVELKETINTQDNINLVMEHLSGPSLNVYIKDKSFRRLTEQEAKKIIYQIMSGLN